MTFTFEVDGITGQSAVIESEGALGLQLLGVIGSTGDEDNTVNVSIVAISDDETASQECYRVEGLRAEDTSVVLIYPGIAEASGVAAFRVNAVLPAKFQIQVGNVAGLTMGAVFHGSTIQP